MFVSPSEPRPMYQLGVVSNVPESYGADYMWGSKLGKVGVQRKVFPGDFLASIQDGRLRKEYGQMKELDIAVLVLEGKGKWTTDGVLINEYGQGYKWDQSQHRNYLTSVQLRGIVVHGTDSMPDTSKFIQALEMWSNKDTHESLERRPAAKGSAWGKANNEDYQMYLLQSLPSVGPKHAKAILDHLGMILGVVVTEEELMNVPGIGPVKAKNIMEVFKK